MSVLIMPDLHRLVLILSIFVSLVQCQNLLTPSNMTALNRILMAQRNRARSLPLKPSGILPVDLKETPDKSLDPTGVDLNPRILREILRPAFNPRYMSVTKPPEDAENSKMHFAFKLRRRRPVGMRPKFLDNFGQLNMNDMNGHRIESLDLKLKKQSRRKLTKFLWTYTHCPVVYKWKDLGPRFWPRWIREGDCHQKERSCSFPPGMKCKPRQSKNINILRFYCPAKRKNCRWIKIFYPIITHCQCSC